MRFDGRRRIFGAALAAAAILGVGCSRAPRDLLFVYSGDCQGYIEPCG